IAACPTPHYDETMSFSETIFLFFLALIIFGPKKLPEIAKQAGRLLAELRRASNEFRSQIETEIAHLEVEKKAQEILPPSGPPRCSGQFESESRVQRRGGKRDARYVSCSRGSYLCCFQFRRFAFSRRDFGRRESRHRTNRPFPGRH